MLPKKRLFVVVSIIIMITIGVSVSILLLQPSSDQDREPTFKGGILQQNETWSGPIFVYESVTVPSNITLTILPGTMIFCKVSRDYKNPQKIVIMINGGTIKAIGTPEEQIWFTSDSENPINGDWQGIEIYHSNTSVFKYVIIEYAGLGIGQFYSQANISHSIVRWVNLEGIYMEHSNPVIEYNLLYQNGYHEISIEQFNYDVKIRNNIFAGEHVAFIAIDSNATLEGNYFFNYNWEHSMGIYAAGTAIVNVTRNKFDGFTNETAYKELVETATIIWNDNDLGNGTVPIPELDFEDHKRCDLGYTPGDPEDQFMYVYPTEDESRRFINRIGEGLGFGWALEYADGAIWKLDTGYLTKIDPIMGNYTKYPVDPTKVLTPRGLAYDGQYFWVQDQTLCVLTKLEFNGTGVTIHESILIPESEQGGRSGCATDGTFLYVPGIDTNKLYELFKNGTINRVIPLNNVDLCGPFTWNGTHFWSSTGNKLKAWKKEGNVVGQIYEVAGGCSGLTWDGTYLWGLYKTCEIWNDAKIFQIEIIDDSIA